ncbi:MAG: RluA family pseudouridine synthase [Chryseotalea sp.]
MKAFDVIYEDNHLLVVNKTAGILVQGDATADKILGDYAKDYIAKKYNKPGAVFLGIVHRLDRPVSGLVVLARTSKALERMNEQFRERSTEKTYWAIVKQKPKKESDTLIHWLKKDPEKNKTTAFSKEMPQTQRAELSYQIIKPVGDHWLLEVKPITGRPHQIRVQLASMGCPIRGDLKYGYPEPTHNASICLHARSLSFLHPVKKEKLSLEAPVPSEKYWDLI